MLDQENESKELIHDQIKPVHEIEQNMRGLGCYKKNTKPLPLPPFHQNNYYGIHTLFMCIAQLKI